MESERLPGKFYVGLTDDLHDRLKRHNAGETSAAQVALEAGNSPQMIFEHYRELVTEEAKAWFAITPDMAKEVRERAEHERQAKIIAYPVKAAA